MDRNRHSKENAKEQENKWYLITEARQVGQYAIRFTYGDGKLVTIDFTDYIHRLKLFAPYREAKMFSSFKIEECGLVIAWPGNTLDFPASAFLKETLSPGLKRIE